MKKKESDLRYKKSSSEEDSLFEELDQFSYAEFLEDESKITMDFSFEDLMEKVEEKKFNSNSDSAKIIAFTPKVILKYVGGIAACGLMVLGSIYALQHNQVEDQHSKIVEVVQHKLKSNQISQQSIDTENSNPVEQKSENEKEIIVVNHPIQTKKVSEIEERKMNLGDETKQEQLVVVNGEEVEDDKMAEEIAINALKLLAKNLNQGNEAVNQLKHLSIEL